MFNQNVTAFEGQAKPQDAMVLHAATCGSVDFTPTGLEDARVGP